MPASELSFDAADNVVAMSAMIDAGREAIASAIAILPDLSNDDTMAPLSNDLWDVARNLGHASRYLNTASIALARAKFEASQAHELSMFVIGENDE